jgi:hypothetical protein
MQAFTVIRSNTNFSIDFLKNARSKRLRKNGKEILFCRNEVTVELRKRFRKILFSYYSSLSNCFLLDFAELSVFLRRSYIVRCKLLLGGRDRFIIS